MNEFKLTSRKINPHLRADSSPESNFDSDYENMITFPISNITFI